MGCPGCSYTSNCSSYIKASYIPTLDHSSPSPGVSYSHSAVHDAAEYMQASPAVQYQHSGSNNPGNGYLPIELDYQVSKALREIEEKKEKLPAVVESSGGITVVPSNIEVIAPKPIEVKPQDNILEMLNNLMPGTQGIVKGIREVEEQTIILKRRKIRQISLKVDEQEF